MSPATQHKRVFNVWERRLPATEGNEKEWQNCEPPGKEFDFILIYEYQYLYGGSYTHINHFYLLYLSAISLNRNSAITCIRVCLTFDFCTFAFAFVKFIRHVYLITSAGIRGTPKVPFLWLVVSTLWFDVALVGSSAVSLKHYRRFSIKRTKTWQHKQETQKCGRKNICKWNQRRFVL